MRSLIAKLSLVATLFTGPLLAPGHAQVIMTWSPSSSAAVAGYYLCWGTNSGQYIFTNTYSSSQTNGTIATSNLLSGQAYFFAVQAFANNGEVSPFSNEASFTNGPGSSGTTSSTNATSIFVTGSSGPPAPGSGSGSSTQNPSQSGGGGSSTPIVSGNGGSSVGTSATTGNTTNSAANFWGVPPFLSMIVSNGQPTVNIGGTVGATVLVQTTTNPLSLDSWQTMTNVTLTNIAPLAQSNQAAQAQDVLDLAFVPAAQEFSVPPSNSAGLQLYRVIMPYDYAILASIVLKGQGYTPRLIVVNMPGIVSDDGCYVNEASSFIHYTRTNAAIQLQRSGSSIRQIATTLANSLSLDWTSASEFTYSNGLGQILATVVETEPSSSDPVAGQNPPSQPMVIDF
jgi:hypothetical protein